MVDLLTLANFTVVLTVNILFKTGDYTNEAYLYNFAESTWHPLPPLVNARRGHMCAVVSNPEGRPQVMVMGGYSYSLGYIDEVETLLLDTEDEWQEGPELPTPLLRSGLVPYLDTFVLMGGRTSSSTWTDGMWKYNANLNTWDALDQKLFQMREGFVAMGIPDTVGTCV